MAPKGSKPPTCAIITSITIVLSILLMTFYSALLAAVPTPSSTYQFPLYHPNHAIQPPSHSRIPVTFREIPVLENLSPSADKAWHQAALTREGGILWVEYNETANAGYGISMFHALHCLQMLRIVVRENPSMKVMWSKADQERQGGVVEGEERPAPMDPVHLGHCIGYIAQHLLCAADGTIEPPWLILDKAGDIVDGGVDGEGYQHHCRDASPLWEAAAGSEKTALKPWGWRMGDTIASVLYKELKENRLGP